MRPAELSFPALAPARAQVAAALQEASSRDDALGVLRLTAGLAPEPQRNLELQTAPSIPAAGLYTGVLYDALDLAGLSGAARRRATRWIVVVSAVHLRGRHRPGDAERSRGGGGAGVRRRHRSTQAHGCGLGASGRAEVIRRRP